MIKFYDFILTAITPFVIVWGKIHWPFTHKKISGADYYKWRDSIEVGTVLLSKVNGEFSNIINPTELKHAGIYVGNMGSGEIYYVLEAVGRGVVLTDLVTFITTKDILVGCKPKFIREDSDGFIYAIHEYARKVKGSPYDYLFNSDGKAFYCFELAAMCLKSVYSEIQFKCIEIVKSKKIYSEETFLDTDFFEIIFDSRKVK